MDLGLAVDQAAAEQAFEGAHQAAFVAFQVFIQRGAAEAGGVFIGVEEHRRGQGGLAVFEWQQGGCARAKPADRGVGGAEVYAAGAGRLLHSSALQAGSIADAT